LKNTIQALVDCKVKDTEEITDDALDMAETDANILTDLRKFNWAYKIQTQDGRFGDFLTDYDCILLNMKREECQKFPGLSGKVSLFDMTVDVNEGTAVLDVSPKEILKLIRTENNDR